MLSLEIDLIGRGRLVVGRLLLLRPQFVRRMDFC